MRKLDLKELRFDHYLGAPSTTSVLKITHIPTRLSVQAVTGDRSTLRLRDELIDQLAEKIAEQQSPPQS